MLFILSLCLSSFILSVSTCFLVFFFTASHPLWKISFPLFLSSSQVLLYSCYYCRSPLLYKYKYHCISNLNEERAAASSCNGKYCFSSLFSSSFHITLYDGIYMIVVRERKHIPRVVNESWNDWFVYILFGSSFSCVYKLDLLHIFFLSSIPFLTPRFFLLLCVILGKHFLWYLFFLLLLFQLVIGSVISTRKCIWVSKFIYIFMINLLLIVYFNVRVPEVPSSHIIDTFTVLFFHYFFHKYVHSSHDVLLFYK